MTHVSVHQRVGITPTVDHQVVKVQRLCFSSPGIPPVWRKRIALSHRLCALTYPVLDLATRWRVLTPVPADLHLANAITFPGGATAGPWTDLAATDWFPPGRWRPGDTFWVQMHAAVLPVGSSGPVTVDLSVFQGAPGEAQNASVRLKILLPRSVGRGLGLDVGGTMLHLATVDTGSSSVISCQLAVHC